MGTTSEKLTYLNTTKGKIKDSINLTGANITTEPFRQYSTKLENAYVDIINNGTDTLYNNFPKVSGEGTSLTLNNTYQAPMRNNLKGNTSQTGTPTPTSPTPVNVVSGDNEVQVWGKNILNTLYQHNAGDVVTSNGITFTFNQDGSIKLSGTATSNAYVMLYGELNQFSTTLFKLPSTFKASGGITYPIGILGRVTGSGTYQELRTATGGTEYGCVFLQVVSGPNVNTTIYPQIEKGSQATNYEPYQGNTYNIDLPVENLFDNDLQDNLAHPNCTYSYVNGEIVVSATGSDCYLGEQTSVGQSWSSIKGQLIEVEPNTTYTYSITNPMFAKNFVVFYDSNKVSTKSNYIRQASYTFTTENTTKYISMRIGNENSVSGTTYKLNVMLEKGSKANSYTPYGTTPIELCKIGNYQDYIYKDSDKWYLHKETGKVTYNGTENWTTFAINYEYQIILQDAKEGDFENQFFPSLCNKYVNHNVGGASLNNYEFSNFTSGVYRWIRIRHNDITTLANYKTWLASNTPTFYYLLATPTNTEITDTTLINQLEELYIAKSKENQTNISQINNDLGFIISASALKKG